MPAFVGFFIAVVILLCLAILLFVGRGILGLTRRYRDARRRRSVTSRPARGEAAEADGRRAQQDTNAAGDAGRDGAAPTPTVDDGPVYICPQLHATWQEQGTCPECDQRGVPMGG